MKKKIFSSILGIIVGILLFWTIINITNNINSHSNVEQGNESAEKVIKRDWKWPEVNPSKIWEFNTWNRKNSNLLTPDSKEITGEQNKIRSRPNIENNTNTWGINLEFTGDKKL